MEEPPAEVTLSDLLIQLDVLKVQIKALECDLSSCCCVKNRLYSSGIQRTDVQLTTEIIEQVIAGEGACTHCSSLQSLREQLAALSVQVRDKIGVDYNLTNETNPFSI